MPEKIIHAFRKTTETVADSATTLPQRYFISPQVFDEELQKIFSRRWVLVGHQSEVAAAGDFFVADIAGESVIVTRDRSDQIHGFYNVCRHRGTRLCEEERGHSAGIQCPYHAWTYGLDGRLVGAPHMDEVRNFKRENYSLFPVNIAVWEGFIFANLAEDPRPIETWFAPLRGKFAEFHLSELRSVKRVEYGVRANWKLMFENYAECYHCPGVHPMLSKVSPYDSAENDLAEGPFLGGFMRINKGKSLTMSGAACAMKIDQEQAQEQEEGERVFYYSMFPNMLLSMHPDYVMVHQLWPQAPDRTLIICDWFFHPDAFARPDFKPEDAVEFWDVTNKQDWHVCELSQKGITSKAYEPGPYSARESIPAAWDREYLRHMQ